LLEFLLRRVTIVTVVLPVVGIASAARAGDWEDCRSEAADQAVAACTRLLGRDQLSSADRAKAYFQRARAYDKQKDYGRAIADYTAALRLNPGDVSSATSTAPSLIA
jgi:tetratricopeptide (TPR) repeat protein